VNPTSVATGAPGQFVEIDARDSTFTTCADGTLQFRYSAAGSGVLRDWSEDPVYVTAPLSPSTILIEARCTGGVNPNGSLVLPACGTSKSLQINVPCPVPTGKGHGSFASIWPNTDRLLAAGKTRFTWQQDEDLEAECTGIGAPYSWCTGAGVGNCPLTTNGCNNATTSRAFQVFAGDLSLVSTFSGGILTSGSSGKFFNDTAVPGPGGATFYVVRQGQFCNAAGMWSTFPAFAGTKECGFPVASCTGAGTPAACCTAAGVGATCGCPGNAPGTTIGRDKTNPPTVGAVGLPF
jgi:hypothetical protein